MDELRSRFEDRARFVTIYIKEAHPKNEWQLGVNEDQGVCDMQPQALADRVLIANDFVERFKYTMPLDGVWIPSSSQHNRRRVLVKKQTNVRRAAPPFSGHGIDGVFLEVVQ